MYRTFCWNLLFVCMVMAEQGPKPREVRFDLEGDRLPDGAVARLGTTRYREISATRLALNTDRTQVIGSDDQNVRVWDVRTGRLLDIWPLPDDFRGYVSPDGRTALHLAEGAIELWDVPRQKQLRRFRVNGVGQFQAVTLSADGATMATIDDTPREHRIRLWNLAKGTERVIGAVEHAVQSLHFAAGDRVVLVNPALPATMFDKQEPLFAFDTNHDREAYRFDQSYLLRVADDGETFIARVGKQPCRFRAKDGERLNAYNLLVYQPSELLALSEPLAHMVVCHSPFHMVSFKHLRGLEVTHSHVGRYTAATFAPPRTAKESATVWLAGQGLFQVELVAEGRTLRGPSRANGLLTEPTSFSWRRHSTIFLMKNDHEEALFDARTQKPVVQATPDGWWQAGLSFTPVSQPQSDTFRAQQPALRLPTEREVAVHLTPSPDGQLVAVREVGPTGLYRKVHLCERITGRTIATLKLDMVGDIAFNATSDRLATLEPTGFRLWDVHTGQQLLHREVHVRGRLPKGEAFGRGVAFSPDQRLLAIGHRDSTVLLWDIALPDVPAPAPSDDDLSRWWNDLASPEATIAWQAVQRFRRVPARSRPFLTRHLKPVQSLPNEVANQLLAELDSPHYRIRERAMHNVLAQGDAAQAFIKQARQQTASADLLKRLDILQAAFVPTRAAQGDDVRTLRALAILQPFTPDADVHTMLTRLAQGLPEARVTQEAKRLLAAVKK